MSQTKRKNFKAITLIEIVISIGIFVLMAATISAIFQRSLIAYRSASDKNQAAQQATGAMEWLVRDFQSASQIAGVLEGGGGVWYFSLITPDSNYITYTCTLGNGRLLRKACNDQDYLVADGLSHFSLSFYNINNTLEGLPAYNPDLRTVEIDMATQKRNEEFRLSTCARLDYNSDFSWAKYYGEASDDRVYSIQPVSDGYVMIGETDSFSVSNNYLLTKIDNSGALQWAKLYDPQSTLTSCRIRETYGGGYIIGGNSYPDNSTEILLLKTDSDGEYQWAKTYNRGDYKVDYFDDVQQIDDGSYIIVGTAQLGPPRQNDVILIKTLSDGELDANFGTNNDGVNRYGGNGWEFGISVMQTNDMGYIIGAYTDSFGLTDKDIFIIKTDMQGTTQWANTYEVGGSNYLYSVQQISGPGYILGGHSGSISKDIFLIEIASNGDFVGGYTYDNSDDDRMMSLHRTSDDGYILAGVTEVSGVSDYYLIKTDSSRNIQWQKAYGGTTTEYLYDLQQSSDGGYILGGRSTSYKTGPSGDMDFFVVKTDSLGELGCCEIDSDINFQPSSPLSITPGPQTVPPQSEPMTAKNQTFSWTDVTDQVQIGFACPSLDDRL